MLGAALLVIPVVFIEEYSTTGWLLTAVGVANWLIWAAFAAEFPWWYPSLRTGPPARGWPG